MEEFKGQFESNNQSEGDNKISKIPISHNGINGFKATSDLSTNSETSEEFRQRGLFGGDYDQRFGGDYEQKLQMESPNFQSSNFTGSNEQQESKQNFLFSPNNFMGNNSRYGNDINSNLSSKFSSSNRVLSNQNSIGETNAAQKTFDIKKYEFKSKYDEYKQQSGQSSSNFEQGKKPSLLFDRKGISGDISTNNENSQPYNPFSKNLTLNKGKDGFGSATQQQNFEFGNKYRFNVNNESTKNTLQNTSSLSGFSGMSGITPNQGFDVSEESEKSYLKIASNLTPSKLNKNICGQLSQGANSSNNFGNFSSSFSHNNPNFLNSNNSSNVQEMSSNYGRKLSTDQFKNNNDLDFNLNNRDLSNENKLQFNTLKKVNFSSQMPSNGFKSLGESRIRPGMQMQMNNGISPSQNGQQPIRPPKYPGGSGQKMGNQPSFEGNPAEVHQQMVNSQKVNNIMRKNNLNIPTDILTYDQDYFPQYTMFLLAEEDKNISNFRERVEKEKQKIESDFEHIKHEMNNLLDDLKIEMTLGVDDHFKQFMERYKVFKSEVIEFKSIKSELPNMQTPPPSQIDSKNSSNVQLIKELEELRYRNQMSKLYQYIGEIQKANVNRVLQASQLLLSQMSSSASLYNTDGCQKQLKELKNTFAENLSKRFDPMSQYVRTVQAAPNAAGLELINLNNNAVTSQIQQQNSPSSQFQFNSPHPLVSPSNIFASAQSNFVSIQQNSQGQPQGYIPEDQTQVMNDPEMEFYQFKMKQMNIKEKQNTRERDETPERQLIQTMEKPGFGQHMNFMYQQQDEFEQYSQPFPLKQAQQFNYETDDLIQQAQQDPQNEYESQQQMQIPQFSQPFNIQFEDEEE